MTVQKKDLEKIIKEYNCSENEAVRAYLQAQENANTTFKESLKSSLGAQNNPDIKTELTIYTPQEIKKHLDKFVILQEIYKRRLSIAAAYHFALINHLASTTDAREVKRFRKKNTVKLIVNRELCEKPKDYLLKLLEKSPFVDFIERFKNEFGIKLIFSDDAQSYIESLATKKNLQVSDTLKNLLSKASCLNYMSVQGSFTVHKKMLEEKDYFYNLFTKWNDKQLVKFENDAHIEKNLD